MIAYEYTCISRYPGLMKAHTNNFREKLSRNDPLYVWKITASDCSDVTSILTKGTITFYWLIMVKIMMNTEK